MQRYTIYEHPLNERVRTLLRLEYLFNQARHFLGGETGWDSRIFVANLMEILDVFARGDIKTELIKEVERAGLNLGRLLETPGVDHTRLKSVLKALEHLGTALRELSGQPGQQLREDEFLTPVRQRMAIPGGTCDFDLPAFHCWLELPVERRREDQSRWFATLDPIRQPIELILKLIRNSAEPKPVTAEAGIYQQSLPTQIPFQMIRVFVASELHCFAEISGGKHRFTIRFLPFGQGKGEQLQGEVKFRMSTCSL